MEQYFKVTDSKLTELLANAGSIRHFYSPGRVNLIGEHIDYCGGHVFPAAIDLGIYFSVVSTDDSVIRVFSMNLDREQSLRLNQPIEKTGSGDWFEYIKGVVASYQSELSLSGLTIVLHSTIPGGGLSSSAALEVGLAVILESYFGTGSELNRKAIAWRTQAIENNFVGVNCGIMDQAAVALGEQQQALLMDCRDLNVQTVPADFGEYQLLVVNSNKDRKLAESGYNQRRAEVEQALIAIQRDFSIENLCEISAADKEAALALIKNGTIRQRARHVIEEQHRVEQSVLALRSGDIAAFGQLLNESHRSLSQLYQVSCAELDFIVSLSQHHEGVVGARMTGAGFGGCAIVLVQQAQQEALISSLQHAYFAKFSISADCYSVNLVAGTREVFSEASL